MISTLCSLLYDLLRISMIYKSLIIIVGVLALLVALSAILPNRR